MERKEAKLIGIDVGSNKCGWAVWDNSKILDYGVIKLNKIESFEDRVKELHDSIKGLCKLHKPEAVVIESVHIGQNRKTGIQLGKAFGAVLAACEEQEVFEVKPLEIRKVLLKNTKAKKADIKNYVCNYLGIEDIEQDAADAIAVILCFIEKGGIDMVKKKKVKVEALKKKKNEVVEPEVVELAPVIDETAIDSMSDDKIRELTKQICEDIKKVEQKFILFSKLLYIVNERKLWQAWGYKSFVEYASKELEIESRKAFYLQSIYKELVVKKGLPEKKVDEIGWTKATKIAEVAKKKDIKSEELEQMLELAKEKSVQELSMIVKEKKSEVTLPDKPESKKYRLSLLLPEDVHALWQSSRERFAEERKIPLEEVNNEIFLGHVLLEFMAQHDDFGSFESINEMLRKIENLHHNLKLIAIDVENNEVLFGLKFLEQLVQS